MHFISHLRAKEALTLAHSHWSRSCVGRSIQTLILELRHVEYSQSKNPSGICAYRLPEGFINE